MCSALVGALFSFVDKITGGSRKVFSEDLSIRASPLARDEEFDEEMALLLVGVADAAVLLLVVVGGGVADLDRERNLVGFLLPPPLAFDFRLISTMCSSAIPVYSYTM